MSCCSRSTASTRAEELDQVEWAHRAPGRRSCEMQFDAQDHEYRRANPEGRFDVIEVDGRARRAAVRRPPARATCGSSTSRCCRSSAVAESAPDLIAELQRAGRRRGTHRQHPRRGAQPGGPALRAARLRGRRGPRRLPPDGVDAVSIALGERRPGSASLRCPGRSGPGTSRGGRARRVRRRGWPAAASAPDGPRKTSENCCRDCPSGPAPPGSVLSTASTNSVRIVGPPSTLRSKDSPTRPENWSKVIHPGSVTGQG